MGRKTCELCGREFRGGSSNRCPRCAAGGTPEGRRQRAFDYFERAGSPAEADILDRTIPDTLGRLVAAWAIVTAAVFLGAQIGLAAGLGGLITSLIACVIALVVVDRAVIRKAHPLDRRRWDRFWHGVLLGYWLCYLLLTAMAVGLSESAGDDPVAAVLALLAFPAACIVGLCVGVANVARTDNADKNEVVGHVRQWQQLKAPPPEPTPPVIHPPS